MMNLNELFRKYFLISTQYNHNQNNYDKFKNINNLNNFNKYNNINYIYPKYYYSFSNNKILSFYSIVP